MIGQYFRIMPKKTKKPVDPKQLAIGRRLAVVRVAKGFFTIKAFADELEEDQDNMRKWEGGVVNPPERLLGKLKERYKVTSDYILFGDDSGLTNALTADIRRVEAGGLGPLPVIETRRVRARG